jgi:hypothetical protein
MLEVQLKSTVVKIVDPHRSENFIQVGVVEYAGEVEYASVSFLISAKSPLPVPVVRALALGAVTTEIAESVETAKTRGMNEATKRRALRMKVARFNAIPMYSFTGAAGKCLFLTRKCLN